MHLFIVSDGYNWRSTQKLIYLLIYSLKVDRVCMVW